MRVELISIGDELLVGQTTNTNAAWLGVQLTQLGASVAYCTVIKDQNEIIKNSLDIALSRVDVVIITGGLGPTKDDITKLTLTEYFDTELEINKEVLEHVTQFFKKRAKEMLDVNIQQAALPKGAKILKNRVGTASGMWFDVGEKVVISLPGVPYEMKNILSETGFQMLRDKFGIGKAYHKMIHLQGIGESYLADRISDLELKLRENGIGLAYLPSPGLVRLRLTGTSANSDKILIQESIDTISERLPQYVYGDGMDSLSKVIGAILTSRSLSVGTAESCTGGAISNEIVRVSGSSQYFKGSIVSYANEIKTKVLGVSEENIDQDGAVSKSVVQQMALNGRKTLNVDYCLATSGIAGPEGGTIDKPVGFFWTAIAGPEGVKSKKFQFGDDRERNIQIAVLTVLNLLRCELLKINVEKS